ncbi:alginate O-acetyltransferase AlgX-related protein [Methylobacterium aquaticum]|uniref:alginate O-acetyltransferase AlgX-related protein n=1 Tax=Methylobacterium aquaticum TaxID=270351 RepID=UPI003D1853B1
MFHIGRDGWLFLTGGSNGAADLYRTNPAVWRMLRGWRRLLLARAARAEGLGLRYLHLVSPEKLSVYDQLFVGRGPVRAARSPARRLGRLVRLSAAGRRLWVDALAPLRAARDGPALYHRTDTHWTSHGTFVAYRTLCTACGATPLDDLLATRPGITATGVMDLGEKLQFPVPETRTVHLIPQQARIAEQSPLHALAERYPALDLHTGVAVGTRNDHPAADPRRLLLFGSSYSGYGPSGLTAMLAETFRSVHFVWSAEIDWPLVARLRPDLVVTESAERYMARLPGDRFDVARYQEEAIARLLAAHPGLAALNP